MSSIFSETASRSNNLSKNEISFKSNYFSISLSNHISPKTLVRDVPVKNLTTCIQGNKKSLTWRISLQKFDRSLFVEFLQIRL
jgi:hypothetical protein